jgi:hypothetical protein
MTEEQGQQVFKAWHRLPALERIVGKLDSLQRTRLHQNRRHVFEVAGQTSSVPATPRQQPEADWLPP